MKNLFLLATLLLFGTAAGAGPRPKSTTQRGYLMLSSRFADVAKRGTMTLVTLPPTGPAQTQVVLVKLPLVATAETAAPETASQFDNAVRIAELKRLNELRRAGWRLNSVTASVGETLYVLEK